MFLDSDLELGATFCIPPCNFEWGFVHLSSRSPVRVGRLIKTLRTVRNFGELCKVVRVKIKDVGVSKENGMTSYAVRKLILSCSLAAIISPFITNAQTTTSSSAMASPVYDLNKEIKIDGTIDKIETNTSGGPIGTHLLVISAQGVVDVHLGASLAVTAKNLGLSVGESIHVTGMMANVGGNSVLLARILTTSNHIYMLRNEHGTPIRSLMPRGAASSANSQKGAL